MRREDRARDADFAWAVFDQASHSVLSMRDGEGGYGVPISPARIGEAVYFHGAPEGKKLLSRFRTLEKELNKTADALLQAWREEDANL